MGYPGDPIDPVTYSNVTDVEVFRFEGSWVTGVFLGFQAIPLIVFP